MAESSPVAPEDRVPFLTVARQAGAGGRTITDWLIRRLRKLDPGPPPWERYDKELVDRIVQDREAMRPLVESLGSETRSWIHSLRASLASGELMTEAVAYHETVEAIMGLVRRGRVIVVGRGAVMMTQDRPWATHVYLMAPKAERIEHMAKLRSLSERGARKEVERLDEARRAFYNRYWGEGEPALERFCAIYNTAEQTNGEIVASILQLVQGIEGREVRTQRVGVDV